MEFIKNVLERRDFQKHCNAIFFETIDTYQSCSMPWCSQAEQSKLFDHCAKLKEQCFNYITQNQNWTVKKSSHVAEPLQASKQSPTSSQAPY
jgi:hypothetical protein